MGWDGKGWGWDVMGRKGIGWEVQSIVLKGRDCNK